MTEFINTEPVNVDIYPGLNNEDRGVLMDNYLIKILLPLNSNDSSPDIFENIDNFAKLFKDLILPKLIIESDGKTDIYTQNINEIYKCNNCNTHYFKYKTFLNKLNNKLSKKKDNDNECNDNDSDIGQNKLLMSTKLSTKQFLMEDFNKQINDKNCKCGKGEICKIAKNVGHFYFSSIKLEFNDNISIKFTHHNKTLFEINTGLKCDKNDKLYKIFKNINKNKCFYKLSYYNVINNEIYMVITIV
jgi:hypothetical protein